MKKEIVITRDGSHTIFIPELNERYHSIHGAISESEHVFIKNGFHALKQSEINILEIGLGTGLNLLLTYNNRGDTLVSYTAIEPFPLEPELVEKLNYPELLDERKVLSIIHAAAWDECIFLDGNFRFRKHKTTLEDFQTTEVFHLIYFDAYAPDVQPELWREEIFSRLFPILSDGGILVTYCAKGSVKRALKQSGFEVQSLPGAPGKREMIRAIKSL